MDSFFESAQSKLSKSRYVSCFIYLLIEIIVSNEINKFTFNFWSHCVSVLEKVTRKYNK